jgi:hypothetical protein
LGRSLRRGVAELYLGAKLSFLLLGELGLPFGTTSTSGRSHGCETHVHAKRVKTKSKALAGEGIRDAQ